MRIKTFIFISIFSITTLKAQKTTKFTIEEDSQFKLSGISNVNEFDCELIKGFCDDELTVCYLEKEGTLSFENTRLDLSVQNFDCKSSPITHDMKKALNHKEFPFMQFELVKIINFNHVGSSKSMAEALVTISGHTNKYLFNYTLDVLSNNAYAIKIISKFNMIDFGITPPTAMMGFIKVDKTITVDLNLKVTMK